MENQIIQINLVPNLSTPAVVSVSQYDVGRPLVFKVYDGTSPADLTGVTAVIEGTKRSGLGFSESGTVTDNTVTLNTTLAMTQEDGSIPAEIRFSKTGEDVGTANFILAVEKTPHAEGTTDGTQETMENLETRLQAEIDDLSDRIDDIEAGGSGLSSTEKQLILTLFSKAAYAEDDAGTAYDALEELWTTTTRTITYNLSHVSSSNTTASIENGQSYTTTLTASTNYTLNSVSVTMGGVDVTSTTYSSGTISISSVTGNIVITATAVLAAQSITATYTQSGTVYDTDSLDSLKADLVVTANYSGGTSDTVPSTDYTLSGTLTEGTSTITVSYANLTTTFTVTVTHDATVLGYVGDNLIMLLDGIANGVNGAHNTTITSLIDQSGNENNWEAEAGTVTATANALVFNSQSALKSTWTGQMTTPNTVEIVVENEATTASCIMCGLTVTEGQSQTSVGALSWKSDHILQGTGASNGCLPVTSGRHTYSFVNDNGTWVGYKDGSLTSFGSVTVSWNTGHKCFGGFIGASGGNSNYRYKGSIYSVRYYSSALSASEIARNYANDITRFGGGS